MDHIVSEWEGGKNRLKTWWSGLHHWIKSYVEGNRTTGSLQVKLPAKLDAETPTDGSFHNHCFRVRGTQAVSCGVNGLHPENIVCPGSQAVTHKPGTRRDSFISILSIYPNLVIVPKILLLDHLCAATIDISVEFSLVSCQVLLGCAVIKIFEFLN